jgi:hypothetical protein
VDWHRPDACGNGVAHQSHASPAAASEALRTAGAAVGTILYGVGAAQQAAEKLSFVSGHDFSRAVNDSEYVGL